MQVWEFNFSFNRPGAHTMNAQNLFKRTFADSSIHGFPYVVDRRFHLIEK